MPTSNLIKEMNLYYKNRTPYHDMYMSYTDNYNMEKLLAPIIKKIEPYIYNKDVLEIACGTGNWTQVLSKRVRSVVATDLHDTYLAVARKKKYKHKNVIFEVADAYKLHGIDKKFSVAFAADWWSHIPKSRIRNFIKMLHSKLLPNSKVIFIDMLPSPALNKMFSYIDEEDNVIQKRELPNGKTYRVVKNSPTKEELFKYLENYATEVAYYEDKNLLRWIVTYTTK
jgi:ubiquinone/menaquinone biosynthesis C-methylase UbiE